MRAAAKSDQAQERLARYLELHDPDFLNFWLAVDAQIDVTGVIYEHPGPPKPMDDKLNDKPTHQRNEK